jgi:hypothetical protein
MTDDLLPDEKSPIDVINPSLKVTLWAMLSEFVHVTVAPFATRMADGLNCNPLMLTDVVAVGWFPPPTPPVVPPGVLLVTESDPPHAAATTQSPTIQRKYTDLSPLRSGLMCDCLSSRISVTDSFRSANVTGGLERGVCC